MTRPAIEVADILPAQGNRFLERYQLIDCPKPATTRIGQRLVRRVIEKRDDFYEEIDTCLNACASDGVVVRRAPCGRIAERQGRE
jgi:hypothetical protein